MYDAVVIGAGPGGYVCAIEIAKLGGKVCVVERNGMGGTCTQRGCIPTKYLHSVGDTMRKVSSSRRDGLTTTVELDFEKLIKRMNTVVKKLGSGIDLLLKENKVDVEIGEAKILSQNKVKVGEKEIDTKNIVISTGGHPVSIPGFDFSERVLSTDTILKEDKLPSSIAIIGGGYSGCEFASVFNALGSKVCLIEKEQHLLPLQEKEIGQTIEKYMKVDGIKVITGSTVEKYTEDSIVVNGESIETEKILVCVGRKPNLNEDELSELGIKYNSKGISVNEKMQTSIKNVYAVGDITGMYELAHVASKQGEVAAHNIMNQEDTMDYRVVPFCVFTYPEVAVVGKLSGNSGHFPLAANAKASCLGDNKGFVKVFEKDGICCGGIVVGPHASEMIGEIALAVKLNAKPKDVYDTIHAHPTLPEAIVDSFRDIYGMSIHAPPPSSPSYSGSSNSNDDNDNGDKG